MTMTRTHAALTLALYCLISCLAPGITMASEKSSAQDSLVQLASRFYNDGEYKRAIAMKDAADTLGASSRLLYYRGMSYSALYEYPRAIECFENAIKVDSANVPCRFQYGRLLIFSGFLERATRELTICTKLDSTYLPAWYQLGLLYNMQGRDIDKECEIFSFLIRQNPEDFLSLYYLGNAIMKTDRADSGTVFMMRSIAVNPRYYPSLMAMAHYHDAKKQYASALEFYRKALEIRPHDKDLLFQTAECLRKSDALHEAVACFKSAIEADSVNDAVHAQLGYAYFSLGRFDSSVQEYKTAIAMEPDNVAYYTNIALAYQKMDSVDAAIHMRKKGIAALHPENLMYAHSSLAAVYTSAKRTQGAIGMYKKNIADACMQLATYYHSNNMRPEAIAMYQRVLEFDSQNVDVEFRIAGLYEEMNDAKSAIQAYTRIMQSLGKYGEKLFKEKIESLKKKVK